MMDVIDVVCAVITNDQGQVFIGKRKSMVSDGIWEFPGGKVENNETKEQALIREIQEELNVEIVIDAFLMDFIDSAFEPQVHVFAFQAHIVSGTMEFHAHKEGKWIPVSDVFRYKFQEADHCLLCFLQS